MKERNDPSLDPSDEDLYDCEYDYPEEQETYPWEEDLYDCISY